MELRHLRYLLAVADARSFTAAATALHVAQPALSQQIRALEKEVGVRLVDRGARTRGLTEAGTRFARRARTILEEARTATEEMAAYAGARRGRIRFGSALQSLTEGRLAAALARFHRRHSGLEVEFREAHTAPLLDLLEAGELDLALVHQSRGAGGPAPSGPSRPLLELDRLYEEPLLLAVGARHPLARRREVRWKDLAGEEFISYGPGATLRELVLSSARESGVTLRTPVSAENLGTVRALVSVGLGVTVLPRAAFGLPGPSVRAVGLTAPRVFRIVTLARNRLRDESPASRTFRDFLRAALNG